MRRIPRTLSSLLLAALGLTAAGQDFPGIARGFAPEKAYQIGDIEHVDLFSGGLTLTLPLGGSYPIGPNFNFGLQLVYSSKLWRYEEANGLNVAKPHEQWNAGLGWTVSAGRLLAPEDLTNDSDLKWTYVDSSGARHDFFQTLHFQDTGDGPSVLYSRDSSYLRLMLDPDPETDEDPDPVRIHTVQFPDGSKHTFIRWTPPPELEISYDVYRLDGMKDAFDNFVDVSYLPGTDPEDQQAIFIWRFTSKNALGNSDTFGDIEVWFDESDAVAGEYADKGGVVKKVRLKAVGNNTATYRFSYQKAAILTGDGCLTSAPVSYNLPFLTKVELPHGAFWEMPWADGSYHTTGSNCTGNSVGLIRKMTLPTKGKMEWSWGLFRFPNFVAGKCRETLYNQIGLAERRHFTRNGFNPSNAGATTWSYVQTLSGPPTCPNSVPPPPNPPAFSTTTVTTPLGDATQHYFWLKLGLPEERYGYTGNDATPPVASRAYDGAVAANILRRTTEMRYEWDGGAEQVESGTRANQRLAYTKTTFHDDPGVYAETISSDFDGLGHYRQTTLKGTFGAGDQRDSVQDFNSTVPAFPDLGQGGGQWTWPAGNNWVLNTFAEIKVCDGSLFNATQSGCLSGNEFARQQFCFDATNGFLKRHRVLAGAAPGGSDVMTVYQPVATGEGFVLSEAYHGGDLGQVGTGDVCTTSPGLQDYSITHTYQHRVRASSQYAGVTFKSLDLTIDKSTGLPTADRDTAALATGLEYDLQGRLVFAKPPLGHGAWTQIQYNEAQPSTKASVAIKRRDNGVTSGTPLAESSITFDDLGRVYREFVTLADGASGRRETQYNEMGQKWKVGEQAKTNETLFYTWYNNYDPFGRPSSITPPDGATHEIQLSYAGDRQVTRRVKIGTGRNVVTGAVIEEQVATTEIYDRQGRLSQVREFSGTSAITPTTTLYKYDEGGRLVEASTNGQVRTFTYDGRGFLISEQHPEKHLTIDEKVTYGGYDARGHATTKVDGPFSLAFTYDPAERLLTIRDSNNANRLLKEWQYDTGAWAGSWPLGKATQAIRHNWINLPWNGVATDVAITERNTYSGRDGRLSTKTTTSSLGSYAFSQGWTFNALGQVTSLNYPNCTHATCTGSAGAAPARNLGMTYTNGWLTGITGFGELTWHSNGLVYQVKHGVAPAFAQIDTQEKDPFFMRRPLSIKPSTVEATLGPYLYDGAGNITDIGLNRFLYDRVSRIKSFEFDSHDKQAYTYDVFGNLTSIATTPFGGSTVTQSLPVAGLTNRLNGAGYDGAGNQTAWPGFAYTYDAFGMMTRMAGGGNDNTHIYTADDERLWTMDFTAGGGEAGTIHTFRLRDADVKVLRELRLTGTNAAGNWSFRKDYIHRDAGRLLASVAPGNVVNHYTLDHLGTPRLVTNSTGGYVSDHHYYAYGQELNPSVSDPMKFTGHERDFNEGGVGNTTDELDYMHARYCSPTTGRFLGVDPSREAAEPKVPQKWNRYAYAVGNPLKFVDPDGKVAVLSTDPVAREKQLASMRMSADLAVPGPAPLKIASGVVGGALKAGLARAGQLLGRLFGLGSGEVQGLFGAVSRATLQTLGEAGGSTVTVLTRQTAAPAAGRGLSVAVGEGAQALASAARPSGTLFKAEIPKGLLDKMLDVGLATKSTTNMGGVTSTEIRFLPGATEFIAKYFKPQT